MMKETIPVVTNEEGDPDVDEMIKRFGEYKVMSALLGEVRKNLTATQESDPQAYNFTLRREGSDKDVRLTLVHKECDQEIVLNDYLPDHAWRIVIRDEKMPFNNSAGCDRENKIVRITEQSLASKAKFLTLFHEISHAHQMDTKKSGMDTRKEVIDSVLAFLKNFKKKIVQPDSGPITSLAEVVPVWFQKEIIRARIVQERNAWADALVQLRAIEKKGFSVFSEFSSNEEIQQFIAFTLLAHQIVSNHELEISARHSGKKLDGDDYQQFLKKDFKIEIDDQNSK